MVGHTPPKVPNACGVMRVCVVLNHSLINPFHQLGLALHLASHREEQQEEEEEGMRVLCLVWVFLGCCRGRGAVGSIHTFINGVMGVQGPRADPNSDPSG